MGRPGFKPGETRSTCLVGSTPTLFRHFPPARHRRLTLQRELVLVGGGHAHVEVLRRFAMLPQPGVRITLVAREADTPYSGMLPGYLGGHYGFRECHVDLAPLCQRAQARLIHGAATGLDLTHGSVHLDGRPDLPFDLLSLDTGSTPSSAGIDGAEQHALAVKPVDRFLHRYHALEQTIVSAARAGRPAHRLLVIGGGAAGVEVLLGLQQRLRRALAAAGVADCAPHFTLVSADAELLAQHHPKVRARFAQRLQERGVTVHCGHRVTRVNARNVICDPPLHLDTDSVLLLTHAAPPAWLRDSRLALDEHGFVCVGATLQSVSHPQVLAAGDMAAFTPGPLLKNGVYAVRQGPVLAENLRAWLDRRPLQPFSPQARTLALISTGDASAIASLGPLFAEGEWVWRLKDWIDRRWMRRYQHAPGMPEEADEQMRCAGCAAKIPPAVLRRALQRHDVPARRPADHGEVLVGLAAADDAAVIRPPAGRLLVRTVDQFPAFIDDAWLFGRIAAHHCLADIYAMGATPDTALALVTLPAADERTLARELDAILDGALAVLEAAGVELVGGHSGEGERMVFGLCVDGYVAPGDLMTKRGLAAGQHLLLTRALGTGVLLAAHMRARAHGAWMKTALAGMTQPAAAAVRILREHGASACTDVSGFGLLGHLGEMVSASGVHARLRMSALPVLPGARQLLATGLRSTLAPANEQAHRALLTDTPEDADALLFDPQTAGGMLAGVPAASAAACLAALHAAGYTDTRDIGDIGSGPRGCVTLQSR